MQQLLPARLLVALIALLVCSAQEERQVYIVYMGRNTKEQTSTQLRQHHLQTLASVLSVEQQQVDNKLHHSYNRGLNGFSASLLPAEVDSLAGLPGVVSVFPSGIRTVSTTRSWSFMGLDPADAAGLWSGDNSGRNVVIGLIDTGIWPESRSFDDRSMPEMPERWKGVCEEGDDNFNVSTCNKKVIGARFYVDGFKAQIGQDIQPGFRSARDQDGHGTHTASTAAGQVVSGASLFGLAPGDATGGAPLAHVAMYKVCWSGETFYSSGIACTDADILAAFDDAIGDGVDVISVSLNQILPEGSKPADYAEDAIALGAFHAVQNGIFVTCSAGNERRYGSVTNVAPWITTVAASSLDRRFPATVVLGNNVSYQGNAINDYTLTKPWYPLVYGGDVGSWPREQDHSYSSACVDGALDPHKVDGTIVFCKSLGSGYNSYTGPIVAGAVGMIWTNTMDTGLVEAFVFDIPTSLLSSNVESEVLEYINSTRNPIATLQKPTTKLDFYPAPIMASFSSQGPNALHPDILKPDVTAPGVDILAAWPPIASPTEDGTMDKRSIEFNMISGTSMSTPHVAATAALLKSLHPTWSPAAIRSALMTTATTLDRKNRPIRVHTGDRPADPLAYGSGHIRPNDAADPGLVYDLSADDYALFLCSIGYNQSLVTGMTGNDRITCPSRSPPVGSLNYPAMSLPTLGLNRPRSLVRTLTNVGDPATYTVKVEAPAGVQVSVTPSTLTFPSLNHKASFTATFSATPTAITGRFQFGSIVWTDGSHRVRMPLVVRIHPRQKQNP